MSDKKLLVVFGATGQQGGSVITALLNDQKAAGQWKIRGITRDPSKPNAKALQDKGVETVTGDLEDKESLRKALDGAYAVWLVTNYWEKQSAELELQQGKNVTDVAKEVGVQHLIWSSLVDVTKLTNGQFSHVDHFDSKAHVEDYIRSTNVPATFVLPGFYMSNIPGAMMRPSQDNPPIWTLALPIPPDTPIPLFDAAADTGKFVKAALTHRDQLLGKRIYAATRYYTPTEIVDTFKKVYPEAGKGAKFESISKEQFKQGLAYGGMSEVAQEELAQNMMFMPEFGYYGKAPLEESIALLEEAGDRPTTWEEFVRKAPVWKDLK